MQQKFEVFAARGPQGSAQYFGEIDSLQRRNLPEFSDQPWLPKALRRSITAYLEAMHAFLGTPALWAPIVARTAARQASINLTDLCSGSGGPAIRLREELQKRHRRRVKLTLTDLFPDPTSVARVAALGDQGLTYHPSSIDAARVPPELEGGRTLICGFHHLSTKDADALLGDAAAKGTPLMIFEVTDRDLPSMLTAIFLTPLLVLILTPTIRRLSALQLFLTYVLPVLPLMIAWDHLASCVRTYSRQDLAVLAKRHSGARYQWEIGAIGPSWLPTRWPYMIGRPMLAPQRSTSEPLDHPRL